MQNLAYGSEYDILLDDKYNVIKHFNIVLQGNDLPFIEEILSFYANVAGDSLHYRDVVLQSTIVLDCCMRITQSNRISRTLLRAIGWISTNLSRPKKITNNFDVRSRFSLHVQVQKLVKLSMIAIASDEDEIKSEALFALSYLTDTNNDDLLTYVGTNEQLVLTLINSLTDEFIKIQAGAIRIVGNLVSSDNNEILEKLIFHGLLSKFEILLTSTQVNLIKETLWALSNITASNSNLIQSVFSNNNLIERLSIMINSPNIDLRKESLWVLTNALTVSDTQTSWQILEISKHYILDGIVNSLGLSDERLLVNILETIDRFLDFHDYYGREGFRTMCILLEERSLLEKLEAL